MNTTQPTTNPAAAAAIDQDRAVKPDILIGKEQFERICSMYENKWDVNLCLMDENGLPVWGTLPDKGGYNGGFGNLCALLMREALRWGETPFELLPDGKMLWVAPVMLNMRLLGGVAAFTRYDFAAGEEELSGHIVAVRHAALELLTLLEEDNLVNSAFLDLQRSSYMSERRRAEAIHAFKSSATDFRAVYIREEPALMSAIRKGDLGEARDYLNRILLALHNQAGDNIALIKTFFLEVVTMMCRSAVEAGCEAGEILGRNYEAFTELSGIDSLQELAPWLHEMMERLIDAIHRYKNHSPLAQLRLAINYMQENLDQEVSRDAAAAVAHLSPAHFSRLLKKEMHETFTDILNRMRIERAAEYLARTDRSLSMVALDCGFKDQSYFTKIFRKYMKKTPREYRLQFLAPPEPGGGKQ